MLKFTAHEKKGNVDLCYPGVSNGVLMNKKETLRGKQSVELVCVSVSCVIVDPITASKEHYLKSCCFGNVDSLFNLKATEQ